MWVVDDPVPMACSLLACASWCLISVMLVSDHSPVLLDQTHIGMILDSTMAIVQCTRKFVNCEVVEESEQMK